MSSYPEDEGHTCSWFYHGESEKWSVPQLWEAARELTIVTIEIAAIPGIDELGCWLREIDDPSHPLVRGEMLRVHAADLSYPVILHPKGWLMDGYHRVAKRLLAGEVTVQAVRLTYENLPTPVPSWLLRERNRRNAQTE